VGKREWEERREKLMVIMPTIFLVVMQQLKSPQRTEIALQPDARN